jgi:excisionase family DNA binding protein
VSDVKFEKILVRPIEAASMLSLSRSKIYELLATGELPHVVIGNVKRIPLAALRSLAEKKSLDGES